MNGDYYKESTKTRLAPAPSTNMLLIEHRVRLLTAASRSLTDSNEVEAPLGIVNT